MVTLAAWESVGLPAEIEQHNRRVRQQLHERLHKMAPAEFEGLIGRLLTAIGFENVVVTAASGDGGIDVRGTLVVGDVIRPAWLYRSSVGGVMFRRRLSSRCEAVWVRTNKD